MRASAWAAARLGAGEQDRRGNHRGCRDESGECGFALGKRSGSDGRGEQHEAEFAGLWQGETKTHRIHRVLPGDARQGEGDDRLGGEQCRGGFDEGGGCVPARFRSADMPTEMKKNPSSRPSKGAISACSSWRYSDSESSTPAMKAPSEGRQARGGGEQCGACDDEQRDGCKDLRRLGATDGPKQRPHEETAADQDDRDRDRRTCDVVPGHMIGNTVAGEQRNQRDQRDEGKILEQQHRKGVAAGGLVSRSRSASIGSTIAVDDIARPAPSTIAPCQATPIAWREPPAPRR